MRYIVTALVALTLASCIPSRVRVEYQEKYIPILYCPAPVVIDFPEYYAQTLTDEQMNDIGELTKAYVISSQESANRITNLRKVYDLYVELAERSEARLNAIEALGGEIDRSLLDQARREMSSVLQSLSDEIDVENEKHEAQMLQSLNQMNEQP